MARCHHLRLPGQSGRFNGVRRGAARDGCRLRSRRRADFINTAGHGDRRSGAARPSSHCAPNRPHGLWSQAAMRAKSGGSRPAAQRRQVANEDKPRLISILRDTNIDVVSGFSRTYLRSPRQPSDSETEGAAARQSSPGSPAGQHYPARADRMWRESCRTIIPATPEVSRGCRRPGASRGSTRPEPLQDRATGVHLGSCRRDLVPASRWTSSCARCSTTRQQRFAFRIAR
jgi:hypothetical protein